MASGSVIKSGLGTPVKITSFPWTAPGDGILYARCGFNQGGGYVNLSSTGDQGILVSSANAYGASGIGIVKKGNVITLTSTNAGTPVVYYNPVT